MPKAPKGVKDSLGFSLSWFSSQYFISLVISLGKPRERKRYLGIYYAKGRSGFQEIVFHFISYISFHLSL